MGDELLLLDIYSAGEKPIAGVASKDLLSKINNTTKSASLICENTLITKLDSLVNDGDVVLLQGAGNVGQIALNLMQE